MLFALSLLTTAWLAGMLFVLVHVRRAPAAFEDERGFHFLGNTAPAGDRAGEVVTAA